MNLEEKKHPVLAIVVPCYNESEMFSMCVTQLREVLSNLVEKGSISASSYLLFVDDGSRDDTWEQISHSSLQFENVRGLKLSRNKGHQLALRAGLRFSDADITISIDADLQDDVAAIGKMVDEYHNGNEIVYGVRNDRTTDSFFKRNTATLFYKMMSRLGVHQVEQHADYRLLGRNALNAFLDFNEKNLYIRGIIPLLGFKSTKVYYSRKERLAGESKYPLKKMLSLALDGITSLSVKPLRIISLLGFFVSLVSFVIGFTALMQKFLGHTIEGWASVMVGLFFMGGVQLLCIGILGEYIGKIYVEVKNRPSYFIEKCTWLEKNNNEQSD
ncbi:glycosyltransferase family 2 protein [Lelliottia sp. RWM.1]|uniref:glycosyltransferase family 2 protein n=1 Tax=Lelliottia sp. RWM.1 TaxID=2663242 RepID=UPI00193DCAA8|nr:glycosyltransferase family 2 protein [Lelliottia sp. RWM.1]MBM3070998.1 glycosyltransferase [Lelliottia sp. RWM.1]